MTHRGRGANHDTRDGERDDNESGKTRFLSTIEPRASAQLSSGRLRQL